MLKRSATKGDTPDRTCVLADGTALRYRIEGPPGAPTLVLSNSLGTNVAMWDAQAAVLAQRFRVLRYDNRGQGASTNTEERYGMAQLARDVLTLLDALEVARAHFCGLSMGGMVGMWLGAHAEERIDRLILCNTAPRIGSAQSWNGRIDAVRKGGLAAIADGVVDGWFTAEFRKRAPRTVKQMRYMLIANPSEGYAAACAAVRDTDHWDVLPDIGRPTLIVSGAHDAAAPPAEGRRMAQEIPGAAYVELDAAHISNVEQPDRFTAAVVDFLGA
jgi:3-oxoadipate enol-lactonase